MQYLNHSLLMKRYFEQVGEFRPNKGTILKASVDYIKLLKGDSEKLKPLEAELKRSEQEIRRQMIRIQVRLDAHSPLIFPAIPNVMSAFV